MNATPRQSMRASEAMPPRPNFRCVVIYEDAAAGRIGERIYHSLAALQGPDCVSARNLWSFPVLAIPEMRNIAASCAAVADVVIFALSGKAELPPHVKDWLEMWIWLIDRGQPVVMPLFDSSNATNKTIVTHLRSLAERKHLDFFPHTGSFASGPARTPALNPLPVDQLARPRRAVTPGDAQLVSAAA